MDIINLNGTEKRLYELVAPLVMNPAVLRQNNNYPFKTSHRHHWFIAVDSYGEVAGFMPVKSTSGRPCIDNYYIRGDRDEVIDLLLDAIKVVPEYDGKLTAVVHKRHVAAFARNGFSTYLEWKNYDKMDYNAKTGYGTKT